MAAQLQALAIGGAGGLQIAEIALGLADIVERDRQVAQGLRGVAERLAQMAAKLQALAIGGAGGLQIAEIALDLADIVERDRQVAQAALRCRNSARGGFVSRAFDRRRRRCPEMTDRRSSWRRRDRRVPSRLRMPQNRPAGRDPCDPSSPREAGPIPVRSRPAGRRGEEHAHPDETPPQAARPRQAAAVRRWRTAPPTNRARRHRPGRAPPWAAPGGSATHIAFEQEAPLVQQMKRLAAGARPAFVVSAPPQLDPQRAAAGLGAGSRGSARPPAARRSGPRARSAAAAGCAIAGCLRAVGAGTRPAAGVRRTGRPARNPRPIRDGAADRARSPQAPGWPVPSPRISARSSGWTSYQSSPLR